MSNIRFTIEKINHFIFVANSSNGVKPKKIMNEVKKISKKFFNVYPEEVIKNWSKNVKVFANFDEHIIVSLEEII